MTLEHLITGFSQFSQVTSGTGLIGRHPVKEGRAHLNHEIFKRRVGHPEIEG